MVKNLLHYSKLFCTQLKVLIRVSDFGNTNPTFPLLTLGTTNRIDLFDESNNFFQKRISSISFDLGHVRNAIDLGENPFFKIAKAERHDHGAFGKVVRSGARPIRSHGLVDESSEASPQIKVAVSLRRDDSRIATDLNWRLKAPMNHSVIGDSAFFSAEREGYF